MDRLGPMSEETKARYSELLIALEQTITQAVQQPDTLQEIPADPDTWEHDVARLQPEAPQSPRLPPAPSPFAPPQFRSFQPERTVAEPRAFGPPPRNLSPDRRWASEYDEARRQEEITGLREESMPGHKLPSRLRPQAPRQFESPAKARGSRKFVRSLVAVCFVTGAVVGGLYFSDSVHMPNAASASATRAFNGAGDRQPTAKAPRMVVTDLSSPKNRPVALGVKIEASPPEASILIKGMPAGGRVTGGAVTSNGAWRIPVRDMTGATVVPPPDYVGPMNLVVDLRLADDTVVDSDVLRLEWTPAVAEAVQPKPVKTTVIAAAGNSFPARSAPPAPAAPPTVATDASGAMAALPSRAHAAPIEQEPARAVAAPPVLQLDREQVTTLVERGQSFLENGDIAAARLLLRRAADAGHVQAAIGLAGTYDPVVLREFGVLGVVPNIETARAWYEKASQLGSAEAQRRLLRLAQQPQ
jgi:hypothetical protein